MEYRTHLRRLIVALSMLYGEPPGVLLAKLNNTLSEHVPAYVIEQFGKAPAVPEGPLSLAMQFAVALHLSTVSRLAHG